MKSMLCNLEQLHRYGDLDFFWATLYNCLVMVAAGVRHRVTEALNCASAAKSHDLSTVNCLVVQRLASAIIQLTDADYQLLVSALLIHNYNVTV